MTDNDVKTEPNDQTVGGARSVRQRLEQMLEGQLPAGFDPYNSTGGFDRKSAWENVGRR